MSFLITAGIPGNRESFVTFETKSLGLTDLIVGFLAVFGTEKLFKSKTDIEDWVLNPELTVNHASISRSKTHSFIDSDSDFLSSDLLDKVRSHFLKTFQNNTSQKTLE